MAIDDNVNLEAWERAWELATKLGQMAQAQYGLELYVRASFSGAEQVCRLETVNLETMERSGVGVSEIVLLDANMNSFIDVMLDAHLQHLAGHEEEKDAEPSES